jgi:hypothetical protein
MPEATAEDVREVADGYHQMASHAVAEGWA